MEKVFDLFRRDYYKVVRFDEVKGKYYSIMVNSNDAVEYKLDKWVKSKYKRYHLTVFDNIVSVKRFVEDYIINGVGIGKYLIFRCKIKRKIYKLPVRKMMKGFSIQWEKDDIFPGWPDGTTMAKKVKIYEKPIKLKGE